MKLYFCERSELNQLFPISYLLFTKNYTPNYVRCKIGYMIITAGKFKGRRVSAPDENITRPTLSKVRMGVFNALLSLIENNPSTYQPINLCNLGSRRFVPNRIKRGIMTGRTTGHMEGDFST
jgi:hypothetical protein